MAHRGGASEAQRIGIICLFSRFLFTIGRRPPGHIGRFPFKEIGHKDLILVFFVAVSKDVSALNGLWVNVRRRVFCNRKPGLRLDTARWEEDAELLNPSI